MMFAASEYKTASDEVNLPVILVAVIEFAIFINMGIPAYTGTVLPFIASIVIGTIQLGAAVDYAILMTNKYKKARYQGAGFAMPGLKESLAVDEDDFDDDFEFPDYVEVTADVEDFSLEMTATVAVAGLMSDSDLSSGLDLKELDDTMDEMENAMSQLKDGGGELAGGLDTLKDSMSGFSSGANTLAAGVNAYTDGAAKLVEGIKTLSDSSGTLESGVNTLNASAKTISDGVQKLDQTLPGVQEAIM